MLSDEIVVQDRLEEQFRSEFSEVEYNEGHAARKQNIDDLMEKSDVYHKVRMIVKMTKES